MLSEDKIIHIVHLMVEGLRKDGLVTFSSEQEAVHEAKTVCFKFMNHLSEAQEKARNRILSQKSPPPEHSSQWQTLFSKYLEEELKKRGG